MVVPVQEVRIRGDALGFAGIGAGVGPFLQQGPVEPLDLAVGLRPVGPVRLCVIAGPRAAAWRSCARRRTAVASAPRSSRPAPRAGPAGGRSAAPAPPP